ncbi:MAG: flagellar filament capping protein FliD [Planctomycetota bacterium]|jgi:flagellar capping protein FliD
MSSVNFSGAGTGIDWSLIIEADIQARTRQVITPLVRWKDTWESKLSSFDVLRGHLDDLRAALEAMDTVDELSSYAVKSNDADVLSAVVSGSPTPGTDSVEINQLAEAEVEIHAGVDDETTVINNSGGALDFAYTYAGETFTLEVTNGTTLEQLAGLINSDPANPGVVASILDDGSGGATSHHLVLRGADTGSAYTISVDAGGTTLEGDWGTLTASASPGSSSITVDDASAFVQYQAIIIDDDNSTAEYHVISSVAGTTLNLQGTLGDGFSVVQNAYATPRGSGSGLASAVGSGETEVTVDDATNFQVGKSVVIADGSGSEEVTISAVDAANNTITFSTVLTNGYGADAYVTQLEGGRRFTFEDTDFEQTQAAQNAQVRVDGYPSGSWIEREGNVFTDLIPGVTLTLLDTTDGSPVNVTVSTDAEGVKEKINAFVDAYNTVKTFLNEATSYDADTELVGVLLGNYAAEVVESMLRDIVISAAPGFLEGSDPYTHLAQVGLETLGRTDDETALGTIEVDETTLDEALAEDFDAVVSLFAGSFGGYSDSDYLTFYQASDVLTTPGTYDVEADFDGGGNLTAGRFKLSSESSFRSATLDSPYIVGAEDNPEHSLWVEALWDGSSTTQTATVRVTQGIAGSMGDLLDDLLDSTDGLLHNIDESYQDIVDDIDDRIEAEQERLELLRERLTAKYARLEQLLVELQGQESWANTLALSMQQSL